MKQIRIFAMLVALCMILPLASYAQNVCTTRMWCDQNGNCRDVQMPCDKGYHLYFNNEHVSGLDALDYTREQAMQNCQWNIQTKPDIAIVCTYNGVVISPVGQ